MGPMTGRAAGYCAGYPVPGFANRFQGRGFGFGRGMGFGFGRGMGFGFRGGRWAAPYAYGYDVPDAPFYGGLPTREQEVETLQAQAEYFEKALKEIQKRIADLEKPEAEK